ncbi:hypothetical protein L484_012060 [Morus notabilis]|uniref:Uncharacterized protein n=1 Tax=Morus notabilis TaxID=981085 RepID=W9S0R8_9ROSA|nr:hypothetical protein L484_012060 [Morus notabilis]
MPSIRDTPLSSFFLFTLSLEPRTANQKCEADNGGTKLATASASAGGRSRKLRGEKERAAQRERGRAKSARGEREGRGERL